MKFKFILSIGVIIFLLFSCEKEENDNKAPVLSSISDKTVTAGESESIELSATDMDGDSLIFSITTNPGFLSITNFSQAGNKAIATLFIKPEKDIEGSYDASIQVSDGKGGIDSETFIITVTIPPYNISDIAGKWSGSAN